MKKYKGIMIFIVVIALLNVAAYYMSSIEVNPTPQTTTVPQTNDVGTPPTDNQGDLRLMEANGIPSCQAHPEQQSYISNQKYVIVNGTRYVVSCDPNAPGYTRCCY